MSSNLPPPPAGKEAAVTSQQSQSASTLLNLDPAAVLTFNEISIFLDRKFSWENYNQVIVELTYLDDKQSKKSKKYTFSEDNKRAADLQISLPDREALDWLITKSRTSWSAVKRHARRQREPGGHRYSGRGVGG